MGEIKYNGRSYSGLIQANGCFIDTDNVIASGSYIGNFSYTATQDCCVYTAMAMGNNTGCTMKIDGNDVAGGWNGVGTVISQGLPIFLKKGQTLTISSTYSATTSYFVYGIQQGSNITFLSEYASACYDTNEREVGCFVDGKPVYQRTFYHRNTQSSFSDFVTIDSIADVETIVSLTGIAHRQVDTFDGWLDISSRPEAQTNYAVCMRYANGNLQYRIDTYGTQINDIYITVQYTKTTDTAGSGQFAPTGMPTHHYSTSEQVIGTYLGKPLYEKTFSISSQSFSSQQMAISNDLSNVERITDYGGSAKEPRDNRYIPLPYFRKNWNECILPQIMELPDGSVSMSIVTNDSWYTSLEDIALWVRYTKTTD